MSEQSICGPIVQSKRGLLAFIWSIVTLLTLIAFVVAFCFTLSARNLEVSYDYDDNENQGEEDYDDSVNVEIAVTSRAMAFSALWTVVLACLLSVFGTVILGFQSPTGQYYTCCAGNVHRTTPLGLGSFIGALLMFSNLTLVCSVLFGEFEIRDYPRDGEDQNNEGNNNYNHENAQDLAVDRSSMVFSIMCIFLTFLYAGFAATLYAFAQAVLDENEEDLESHRLQHQQTNRHNYSGYIDNRFDVHPSKPSVNGGFVGAQGSAD